MNEKNKQNRTSTTIIIELINRLPPQNQMHPAI